MESSSRTSSVEPTSHRTPHLAANKMVNKIEGQLANLIGNVIALLTLTVPLLAIAHFSASTQPTWQPTTPLVPEMQQDAA